MRRPLALQMLRVNWSGRRRKKPGTAQGTYGDHDSTSEQRAAQHRDRRTDFSTPLVGGRASERHRRLAQWHFAREAQEFLFDRKEDFEMVCTAAGLDSGDFRVQLLKIGHRVEMRTPFSPCFAT
jgi:hypothetical protein